MIKDILVHLDGSADDEGRLAHAEALAVRFGAHLRGLYLNPIPDFMIATPEYAVAVETIMAARESARTLGDEVEKALSARFSRLGVPADLRREDVFAGAIRNVVAREARSTDLLVAMKPYPADAALMREDVLEAALFDGGRAVYVVPDRQTLPPREAGTVLVAWNNTREGARAVAEAMPFLAGARQVVLATMDRDGTPEERREEPGADIARHLDRHGVKVELRHLPEWNEASEALLNEARRLGADLVVLGGYGHSRFREWVIGGATRDFLTLSRIPLLMAH